MIGRNAENREPLSVKDATEFWPSSKHAADRSREGGGGKGTPTYDKTNRAILDHLTVL